MEKLSILYYVRSFPKLSESFILNEINELHDRGHNVAVFARDESEEDVRHDEYKKIDIPITYWDASYADFPQLFSKKPVKMAINNTSKAFFNYFSPKQIGHNLLLGKHCAEFIESLNFGVDVVHAHFANPTKVGAMLAARYHDIPCTVTAHATEIFSSPNTPQIKYICDRMNHVIVPSKYNQQYLREDIGIKNGMTIVPATTRIEKFNPSAPTIKNRLLTVGRLVEKKGHIYAIRAVSNLVENGYDINYHIVGDGERKKLLDEVINLGIEDNVEFLGKVSDKRLKQELSEAAIFVLPCVIAEDGDRDAMPVVLKEAMASETVCVSTTISAVPELIETGHNGLLAPQRDSEQLTAIIKKLLDCPKKREKLARNGRKTVNNRFRISESAEILINLFDSLRTDDDEV